MTRNSKLKKHSLSFFLVTILGLNLLTSALSSAAILKSKELKAPCRLEVADAHISKNTMKKEGKLAVKVVFKSICNLDQENLIIKVQIVKKGFFGSQSVTPIIVRKYPFVKANRWVLIKNIYAYCKTTKSTYFSGTAEAQAYVNGTQVFAPRAQSEKSTPIECGT
jgi:hypothetical protein